MTAALYHRLPAPLMWSGSPALTNFTLNESTDTLEFIVQMPEAVTITRLGYRVGTVTGTSPTYRISLQGVTDGIPDGTIKGGGSPASATFTQASTGWKWTTLDNSYTCSRGELLAIVIDYSSGTISGVHNLAITSHITNVEGGRQRFPYAIQNNAGSRSPQGNWPVYGVGTASTVYGHPVSAIGAVSGSDALLFTLPAGWGDTYKVVGVRTFVSFDPGATITITLYEGGGASDTTKLQEIVADGDNTASAGSTGVAEIYFDEATLSTLSFGSTYRLYAKDSGGGTAGSVRVLTAADLDAYVLGQTAYGSDLSGTWTDNTTHRPLIEPIFADITEPAAGGGGGVKLVGIGGLAG